MTIRLGGDHSLPRAKRTSWPIALHARWPETNTVEPSSRISVTAGPVVISPVWSLQSAAPHTAALTRSSWPSTSLAFLSAAPIALMAAAWPSSVMMSRLVRISRLSPPRATGTTLRALARASSRTAGRLSASGYFALDSCAFSFHSLNWSFISYLLGWGDHGKFMHPGLNWRRVNEPAENHRVGRVAVLGIAHGQVAPDLVQALALLLGQDEFQLVLHVHRSFLGVTIASPGFRGGCAGSGIARGQRH